MNKPNNKAKTLDEMIEAYEAYQEHLIEEYEAYLEHQDNLIVSFLKDLTFESLTLAAIPSLVILVILLIS